MFDQEIMFDRQTLPSGEGLEQNLTSPTLPLTSRTLNLRF